MIRHIALMLLLIAAAIGSGIALVPGERERWTMLVRDSRNEEALKILEARYNAGSRDPDAVLQLYKLLMADAQIARATQLIEQLASARPNDVETLTLLAKHYSDTQDRLGQVRTLERLFELEPSAKLAENLLANYRLDGAFAQEEKLLHAMLARKMIAANDAERLGLLALAHDDIDGAREALAYYDTIAAPEQMAGRFALFDLLVRSGNTQTAFSKAAAWSQNLQKANPQLAADPDGPVIQLAEWMNAAANPGAAQPPTRVALIPGAKPPERDFTGRTRPERHGPATRLVKSDVAADNAARRYQTVSIRKAISSSKSQERQLARRILQQQTKHVASRLLGRKILQPHTKRVAMRLLGRRQ